LLFVTSHVCHTLFVTNVICDYYFSPIIKTLLVRFVRRVGVSLISGRGSPHCSTLNLVLSFLNVIRILE
jgi:hypothetical protein